MTNPLADLADTFICVLDNNLSVAYGPFDADEASAFLTRWNDFATERNWPGTWISIPLHKVSVETS